MREKNWLTKIIVILIGSIISAYGITLAMYAGFGSATLAVLWQGVSKVTGMSIGMTSFVIAVVMIVFVWFYDRSTDPYWNCSVSGGIQWVCRDIQ